MALERNLRLGSNFGAVHETGSKGRCPSHFEMRDTGASHLVTERDTDAEDTGHHESLSCDAPTRL
jgi:hypothetical protein